MSLCSELHLGEREENDRRLFLVDVVLVFMCSVLCEAFLHSSFFLLFFFVRFPI